MTESTRTPNDVWDEWSNIYWKKTRVPIHIKYEDNNYYFYLVRNIAPIGSSFEKGTCKLCIDRSFSYQKLVDNTGGPVFLFESKNKHPVELFDVWDNVHSKIKYAEEFFDIKFVTDSHIDPVTTGSYPHYNIWSSKFSKADAKLDLLQNAFYKYYPLVLRLFKEHGTHGIKSSMATVNDLLLSKDNAGNHQVPYADMIIHAVRWFTRNIVEDFNSRSPIDQAKIVINAILDSHISDNSINPNDPVLIVYHQINGNIKDAMTEAQDTTQFINWMKFRFSPINYMRRTTDNISDNQIDIAIATLGSFIPPTVMSKKEALALGAIDYSDGKENDSITALENMKLKKTTRSGMATFPATATIEYMTLKELLQMRDISLEVYAANVPALVATAPDGLKDKLKHEFMWSYFNSNSPSMFGFENWCKVSFVMPTSKVKDRHRNYIFCCENIKKSDRIGGCYFPAFLKTEYARLCGIAFEKFNNDPSMSTTYKDDSAAIGIGISITGEDGQLYSPVRVRINGNREVTIRKWD